MYPISDLTAFCRRTTGDVPPKLVGASTTVVGSKMYLYGGRLVAERKMVSDIYVFDLETFRWDKVMQVEENVPQARYFHSADTWNNHLIIFGGMAIKPLSDNPEDLCVLNDVRLFDLTTNRWLPPSDTSPPHLIPKARYAHLSSVTSNRLFVIGGQDLNNVWLDDIHVYDLPTQTWVQRRDYPRHCGTYRSVAVTATKRVRLPQEEGRRGSDLAQPGTRFSADKNAPPVADVTQTDSLIHLPYSTEPTDDFPCDIFLFSNYNFTDVQRELEVFSPLPGSDFIVSDRSASMTGAFFPPGLRFPTGAILGTHFIVAGTYLSQTFQSFSIWALDLVSMTWTRIDPGSTLSSSSGSWFRSCLWPEANRFLVFGNRHGNLVEDYNRRLLSWDHVICIDLEAFGIYQPPPLLLDLPQQELGLAALEEGILADFEIVCDDGRKIKCSRKLLEDRWPWFKQQRQLFLQAATHALEMIPGASTAAASSPLPDVHAASDKNEPRPDPRLTPRALNLSEPYPITLALLQYLYSMALVTPLQHAPAVLSQLLLISSTYDMPHLQSLVKHAMHRALSFATSVGIYGVATLCNCRSLQIRALRVVMAYSQKRPNNGRSRGDRDASGGGSRLNDAGGGPGGPGGPTTGGHHDKSYAARPRGMSDASYMHGQADVSSGRAFTNGTVDLRSVVSETDLARLLSQLPPGPFHVGRRRHRAADSVDSTDTAILSDFASPSSSSIPSSSPQYSRPVLRSSASTAELRRGQAVAPPTSPSIALACSSQQQPGITVHPVRFQHHHRGSVVSMATEQELFDLADIISPAVDADDTNALLDQALTSESRPTSLKHRLSMESNVTSVLSTSALSYASVNNTDYCDSAYLAPRSPHPSFHLPRLQQRYLSDTSSLATSDSYSTISSSTPPTSPAIGRSTSFPRLSPASVLHSTSTSPTSGFSEPMIAGLDVIYEGRLSEEMDRLHLVRNFSKDTLTLPQSPPVSSFSEIEEYPIWHKQGGEFSEFHPRAESPKTIMPAPYSALAISSCDTTSSNTPSSGQTRRSTFQRLFKHSKGTEALIDTAASAFDSKVVKAEEKKRKKQLEKERTERLTEQLKAQTAAKRTPDSQPTRSPGNSSGKQQPPMWEEGGGFFTGVGR